VIKQGLFFLSFVFILSFASTVSAQAILKIFDKEMPQFDALSEEEFLAATNAESETPVGARGLAFDVRIPKDWMKADDVSLGSLIISDKILSNLARYFGPVTTGTRHQMLVQVVGVDHQMTAKQWFVRYILENGYTVEGVTVYDDRRAEGLYIFVEDNISYVVRSVVQINGKNVVFVQHFLPIEEWHDNKVMQAQVLTSFALQRSSDEDIEEMKGFTFLDIATFQYPESWRLKANNIRSVDRMKAEILNLREKTVGLDSVQSLSGRIGFNLISIFATDGIDEEIEKFKLGLAEKDLYVQEDMGDYTDFVFNDPEFVAETYVFKIVDKHRGLQEYEYWITVMGHGDYYYFVTMLTPARENDFLKWSRNTQAYKIVAKKFKPLHKAQKS
jgi:hypothetical protein